MRRAIVTIGGTAAGLAALLAFKTHPIGYLASSTSGGTSSATPGASPDGAGGLGAATSASPSPSMKSPSMKKRMGAHGSGKGMRSASPSPSSSSSPSSLGMPGMSGMPGGTRTITGTVASTQYGPVQVQVVLDGPRITKVNVLQQTDEGQMSNQIDSFAIPKLTSETLTAQSARIDAVSGATFTSQGYIQSLQSALLQA
jgi:uncharacterized protein with FMN-binding domain